ncbi:RNA polymerase sigma-70 factor, sigma-E family [Nocardioides exalbidus]|uniref:RNA polymerase sigma-70 factor, sigma-E family n=1 Tax=Nocardioides exalbidus TaxID=402596 RepID=A0A1H4T037_9ACTN|nr:SigE family RNA polymerase sigma factor [Nocardioides exalbidus]SEC49688.1 RNA polymerase sigma-70 factor, sigma-E family [Nocardioides exalbidus]
MSATTDLPDLRVAGARDRDFAAYVDERRPALLRWARAVAGDPHTAEDLLQTSLVRVLPHWGRLRDAAAADAYVRRAILHQHVSWQRQRWRRSEAPTDLLPEPDTSHDTRHTPEPPGPDLGVELWRLVNVLPTQQRATVALRFYEGLSVAETATVLGCSSGTVKSNTSRALAALRRRAAHSALAG